MHVFIFAPRYDQAREVATALGFNARKWSWLYDQQDLVQMAGTFGLVIVLHHWWKQVPLTTVSTVSEFLDGHVDRFAVADVDMDVITGKVAMFGRPQRTA